MMEIACIEGRNLLGVRVREIRIKRKLEVTLEDLAYRLAARGVPLDRSAIGRIAELNELQPLASRLRHRRIACPVG